MMRSVKLIVAATLMLGASLASANKLSDFKDAVETTGCESIPYGDLRSNCKSEQIQVHEYCDGRQGPVTCGSDSITRQLRDNLERERKSVETLKEKKRNLEEQKSRATDDSEKSRLGNEIQQVDRDIYDAGMRVDQAVTDLDTRKKFVDDAIYTLDKCMDYRRAVMNVFATAMDRLRGEHDEEIKPLARQIRDKHEEKKRGHEIAISDKKIAQDNCKNWRP